MALACLIRLCCPIAGAAQAQAPFLDSGSVPIAESRAGSIPSQSPESRETGDRPAHKSVGTAYALSILGTAVPLLLASQIPDRSEGGGNLAEVLFLGGLLVGPSLGQFYAGSIGGGALGFGIRSAGSFMSLMGIVLILGDAFCFDEDEDGGDRCDEDGNGGGAFLIAGGITYLGGAIYSLLDAGWAVERYNARLDEKRVFGWSPTLAPAPQGGLKPGVMAWMRF